MKLKNEKQIGDTWTRKKFAIFPVQLGEFGRQGQLLEGKERIWWEHYYVEYQLCMGLVWSFTRVTKKYQL